MKPSLLSEGEPKHPIWIKPAVLVVLCVQNSSHALLTRYSQGILKESYSSTEVVLVGEIIKLLVSGYLSVTDSAETDAVGKGLSKLYWLTKNSHKVIVLVILYSVANILSYYALARVDASVYTVCLQLKIFSTAAFAVLMLGRNINITKWRALMLLVLGCVLVASPTFNKAVDCAAEFQRLKYEKKSIPVGAEVDYDNTVSMTSSFLGVATIMVMVTISGYSAIYFEQMLKTSALQRITIWERNFQLALYSILLLCGILFYEAMNDGEEQLNIGTYIHTFYYRKRRCHLTNRLTRKHAPLSTQTSSRAGLSTPSSSLSSRLRAACSSPRRSSTPTPCSRPWPPLVPSSCQRC